MFVDSAADLQRVLCLCQHKRFLHSELEQKKNFFSFLPRVPDGCRYHLLWNSRKFFNFLLQLDIESWVFSDFTKDNNTIIDI